jgi:hypothetical protein
MERIGRGNKRILFFIACIYAAAACFGCAAGVPVTDNSLALPDGMSIDYENIFFDDFIDGIDYDTWAISKRAWGQDNGGVVPQNVNFTNDGYAVLSAHGNYYSGDIPGIGRDDGTKTGGVLLTRDTFGPGRFETSMKVMPRVGGCSTMWTFGYFDAGDGDPENHEIDIEIPINGTFRQAIFTNWQTEKLYDSTTQNMRDFGFAPSNDGKFHTYTFDWMTDPAKVIYYIDGVKMKESEIFVPTALCNLWIGVWFPFNWAGEPNFDSDDLLVDWVRIMPFKDQPAKDIEQNPGRTAAKREYPQAPVEPQKYNMVANGGFEYSPKSETNAAWKFTAAANTDGAAQIGGTDVYGGARSLIVRDAAADQVINGIYGGYRCRLEFFAKASGAGASVDVSFLGESENILSTVSTEIKSANFTKYDKEFVAPAETAAVRIRVKSLGGGVLTADDFYMEYLGIAG